MQSFMSQAIVTRYLSATNSHGARILAKAGAGSVSVYWDHSLNTEDNHRAAAMKLAEKVGWVEYGPMYGGGLPDTSGYCFVFPNEARVVELAC